LALRPGTPSLLREINDCAALELLLTEGALTRSQVGERTGLSKVTASQTLTRLQERGLVTVTGQLAGGRGPSAAVYAVVPSSAYVAALDVSPEAVTAGVADVTGRLLTEVTVDPNGARNPVQLVRNAVSTACRSAQVEAEELRAFVIGTGGMVDARTGDVRLFVDMPDWHEGVLDALRQDLRRPVTIENDVNLAAMAEHALGAAQGMDDFVLVWLGVGLGLATILGGRLHRGARGAAGEIGYLPVPGVPLPEDLIHPGTGGFRSLVDARSVRMLAERYGFTAGAGDRFAAGQAPGERAPGERAPGERAPALGPAGESVAEAVAAAQAGEPGGEAFLDDLARRVAVGVASVVVTLDPELVVLGGEVGQAGGEALAGRVSTEVGRIFPVTPDVVPTAVPVAPVLRGALLAAVYQARSALLASVADD
jgi:predicted NBD/HSP70 family sugar kinase